MATQSSTPSAWASAKRARRQARRAESLSGSIRQFLTPEVWKQARQAARAASCRNDPRWTLQPLILLWAMMTWCTAPTDAEQFLTTRTFYVRVHGPKRKRPGKHFGGFHEAVQRLPLTVWWAVAAAVRRQVFRTLADRMVVDGWIKTSKRVVKDVRLVSRTTAMVVREAEGSLLACPLLLAQGSVGVAGGQPACGSRRGEVQRLGGAARGPAGVGGVRRAVAEDELRASVTRMRSRSGAQDQPQGEEGPSAAEEASDARTAAAEGPRRRATRSD